MSRIDAISLIGFILVLGLLVDDAVVVGESAYVAQREGAGQLAGAIEGARRVFVPVTFGVLTTVAAFVPMLFLTGVAGQFMAAVAAPVICCLVFLVDRVPRDPAAAPGASVGLDAAGASSALPCWPSPSSRRSHWQPIGATLSA